MGMIQKKKQVFSRVVDQICEFVGANDPTFKCENMGHILILQVDDANFQDSQMSQEAISIVH